MTLAVSFYDELSSGGMARAREVFPRHSVFADGSMAIFRSRDAAERFVANDPFVVEGVVARWRILDWNGEPPEPNPA